MGLNHVHQQSWHVEQSCKPSHYENDVYCFKVKKGHVVKVCTAGTADNCFVIFLLKRYDIIDAHCSKI